jgi:hypothetical protein
MRFTAMLGGLNLPTQFSYKPYIARKRVTVTATAKAVVTQSSNPVIVHGDGSIPWNIEGAYPNECQSLYDLYNESTLTLLEFYGYWGERFHVYFTVFDAPTIRGRIANLSGQIQVAAVVNHQLMSCGSILDGDVGPTEGLGLVNPPTFLMPAFTQ